MEKGTHTHDHCDKYINAQPITQLQRHYKYDRIAQEWRKHENITKYISPSR